MPSDAAGRPHRLHPLSLLFSIGSAAKGLLLPGIVVFFWSGGGNYEIWLMIFFLPAAVISVIKYITYRYRLGEDEMMVRQGILTRSERHIPYARIQNVNLVQNPFHRILRVAEVHLETASGSKPEAIIRVISLGAVETIRDRVFSNRSAAGGQAAGEREDAGDLLLALPTRELVLLGLISNRGMAVIAALMGILWQADLWDFDWERVAKEAPKMTEKIGIPIEQPGLATSIAFGVALVVIGIVLMKLLSVVWSLFRFHGFTLQRRARDLRARYGLLTRYTAAIPTRRIQLLSSRTTPLHRLFHRSGVLAETAGGGSGNEGEQQRETHRLWLAPIIQAERVADLTRVILPDVDLSEASWNKLPVRARRRVRNRAFFVSTVVSVAAVIALGVWGLAVAAVTYSWAVLHAAMWWKHAAWAIMPTAMAFRSGWWTRRASAVRFAKIQTVSVAQSPFDRRYDMARLVIDTAGAGKAGHRVNIPYLPQDEAARLHERLAREAAQRDFRW